MISQLQDYLSPLVLFLEGVNAAWIWCPVVFFVVVLIWRLWMFTIRPSITPNEVKVLPYWIPCKPLTTDSTTRGYPLRVF